MTAASITEVSFQCAEFSKYPQFTQNVKKTPPLPRHVKVFKILILYFWLTDELFPVYLITKIKYDVI